MQNVKTISSLPLSRLIALSASPVILAPLWQYLAVAPFGAEIFLWAEVCLVLPFLIALVVVVVAPFLLLVRSLRPFAWRSFLASCVVIVAVYTGILLGSYIRKAAFYRLAERSIPLVQAIHTYQRQHGTPPPRLEALVPEFLPTNPRTGMATYPNYEYHVGEEAKRYYAGNPWALVVYTPSGGINFDTFMYLPLQNYPKTGYGGSLERILDWA